MPRAIILCFTILALLAPVTVHAQSCTWSGDCFMGVWDCHYFTFDSITYGSYTLAYLDMLGQSSCAAFPPPGSSATYSFGARADFRLAHGGVEVENDCPAAMTVKLTTVAQNGTEKYAQSEILQWDVSGGTLPAGVLLRESPTLASSGQAQSEGSGTNFTVTGTFDLLTELSTDNGQTWTPGSGPAHMTLMPGLPTQELTWGRVKATYR